MSISLNSRRFSARPETSWPSSEPRCIQLTTTKLHNWRPWRCADAVCTTVQLSSPVHLQGRSQAHLLESEPEPCRR